MITRVVVVAIAVWLGSLIGAGACSAPNACPIPCPPRQALWPRGRMIVRSANHVPELEGATVEEGMDSIVIHYATPSGAPGTLVFATKRGP